MAKRAGYVYQRPGRSLTQVTGATVRQTPEDFARRGKTPEDRARGRFMLEGRRKGWDTDPTELGDEVQIFSKGSGAERGAGGMDVEIRVGGGRAQGVLVSRYRSHLVGNEHDARISFNPARGIPTPSQARAAFEARRKRGPRAKNT